MVNKKNNSRKLGFTLIELTITIGILGLALTATGGILISVVRSFQKQAEVQRIERNGDNVSRVINERVRKAKNIVSSTGNYNGKVYNYLQIYGTDNTGADNIVYIGRMPDGGKCDDGYMFFIETPNAAIGTFSIDNVGYRLSDDGSDGVNISNFTTSVSNGTPVQVSATIQVESSKCSGGTTNIVRRFSSFATARASY